MKVRGTKGVTELARKLGVSRQRAWSILKRQEGKCIICGKPLDGQSKQHCQHHLMLVREYKRTREGHDRESACYGTGRKTHKERKKS